MTTPAPVQLPLTREQALEIADRWWNCPGDHVLDNLLRDLGLAYAEPAPAPPPEPRWPAKLVVERRECARLLIAADGEGWYFALSTPGHLDQAAVAEEVARRWSRCAELEEEVSVLLQRKDQAEAEWRRVALDKQQRIDALLGTLAERTREQHEALADADARRIEAENYERLYVDSLEARKKLTSERDAAREDASSHLAAYATVHQKCSAAVAERDAARQEAAELRRRCEWAVEAVEGRVIKVWGNRSLVAQVLRGTRLVPGSEGGSGA